MSRYAPSPTPSSGNAPKHPERRLELGETARVGAQPESLEQRPEPDPGAVARHERQEQADQHEAQAGAAAKPLHHEQGGQGRAMLTMPPRLSVNTSARPITVIATIGRWRRTTRSRAERNEDAGSAEAVSSGARERASTSPMPRQISISSHAAK